MWNIAIPMNQKFSRKFTWTQAHTRVHGTRLKMQMWIQKKNEKDIKSSSLSYYVNCYLKKPNKNLGKTEKLNNFIYYHD